DEETARLAGGTREIHRTQDWTVTDVQPRLNRGGRRFDGRRDHFRRVIPQIDPLNKGSRMRRNIARMPAGGALTEAQPEHIVAIHDSGQGDVERADIERGR